MQKSQNRYIWKIYFRMSANLVNTYPFVFPSSFLSEVLIQHLNPARADNHLLYPSLVLLVVYAQYLL